MSSAEPRTAALTPDSAEPIRAELLSTERLEHLAEALAVRHSTLPGKRRGRDVLKRLEESGRVLHSSYRSLADSMSRESGVTPAAEWLVDNFHLVEEQIREIRQDLPAGFYAELPKLASGPFAGFPRVYTIAWHFVAHTDSYFEIETLRRFIAAYQHVQTLTTGELWALTISLRLVLVENLRRLVEEMDERHGARVEADILADAFLRVGNAPPTASSAASRLAALENAPLRREFAVRLLSRLREQDPAVTPVLAWLDRRMASENLNADDLVRHEHQAQIATHVTVRNVITTMRLISAVDWNAFFESVSLVEAALRAGTRVAEMDFATRDRYRHAVEQLAKTSRFSETEVARRAVAHARGAAESGREARFADPGYYLISEGRQAFESELRCRVSWTRRIRRAYARHATPGYLGTLLVLTAAIAALPVVLAGHGTPAPAILWMLTLLAIVPASELAISIVNRDVTEALGPRRLPKLEFLRGVPSEARTLVAVPVLLTDGAEIREALERLEVHYLGNGEGEVFFALLSDWVDSAVEIDADDEALLAATAAGVAALNEKYGAGPGGERRFFLLHRRRLWNPAENVWMGWERKRGKLQELNRLLAGARDTSFLSTAGETVEAPRRIRYVVTLDADTRLARDDVAWLAGTMAHPLNEPVFDPASNRVVEGYGVLQPGVTPTLPAVGAGTMYQRLFSGPRGIDPYAFAVSDVYQDLFGEGIYTGKGIYDVHAFGRALAHRVPQNALLSHDLFEGLFARAGLASDILLFEEYPGHYEVAASRQHRWTRGDWQLLPWLLPRVPAEDGRFARNPLPAISRWKILDNLRRSLFAPTAAALLAASWLAAGPGPPSGASSSPRSGSRRCSASSRSFCLSGGDRETELPARARLRCSSGPARQRCGSPSSLTRPGCFRTRSFARCGASQSRAGICSSGRTEERRGGIQLHDDGGGRRRGRADVGGVVGRRGGTREGVRQGDDRRSHGRDRVVRRELRVEHQAVAHRHRRDLRGRSGDRGAAGDDVERAGESGDGRGRRGRRCDAVVGAREGTGSARDHRSRRGRSTRPAARRTQGGRRRRGTDSPRT